MKYLLFAGHNYYPDGGARDLFCQANSVEELKDVFLNEWDTIRGGSYIDNWGHIVEKESMKIILYGRLESAQGTHSTPGVPVWTEKDPFDYGEDE